MTPEQQQQISDRDRAVRAAMFAADHMLISNPQIYALPKAHVSRLTVEAAVGYLIGHGLITVKPESEWPEWLAMALPEHMEPDVRDVLDRFAAMSNPGRVGA